MKIAHIKVRRFAKNPTSRITVLRDSIVVAEGKFTPPRLLEEVLEGEMCQVKRPSRIEWEFDTEEFRGLSFHPDLSQDKIRKCVEEFRKTIEFRPAVLIPPNDSPWPFADNDNSLVPKIWSGSNSSGHPNGFDRNFVTTTGKGILNVTANPA